MKSKGLLILILPLITVGSCTKEKATKTNSGLDGAFAGRFTESRPGAPTYKDSVQVTLTLSGEFSTGHSPAIIPTGAGNFTSNGQAVSFTNLAAFPDNVTVNKSAVLNGEYSYIVKADSLILTKTDAAHDVFTYKLKKH